MEPKPIERIQEIAREFDLAIKEIDDKDKPTFTGLSLSARIFLQTAQSGHPHSLSPEVANDEVQNGEFD